MGSERVDVDELKRLRLNAAAKGHVSRYMRALRNAAPALLDELERTRLAEDALKTILDPEGGCPDLCPVCRADMLHEPCKPDCVIGKWVKRMEAGDTGPDAPTEPTEEP